METSDELMEMFATSCSPGTPGGVCGCCLLIVPGDSAAYLILNEQPDLKNELRKTEKQN